MNNITLLHKLLSDKFDMKLNSLERNSKHHLDLINTSVNLSTKVVSLCVNIRKKVKEKHELKIRPLPSFNNSIIKKISKNGFISKYNQLKIFPQTPIRKIITSSKSVSRFDRSGIGNKELIQSKSYGNILNRRNSDKITKKPLIVQVFSPTNREVNIPTFTTNNIKLNKGEKQKQASLSSSKITNNSIKVMKVPSKIKNIKLIRRQTPHQISRTQENNDSIDRILSIDNTIHNDYLLNKEDPMLLMPITDKYFIDLTEQIETNYKNCKYKIKSFHIEDWIDDYIITTIK